MRIYFLGILLFASLLLTSCAGPSEYASFFTQGNCEECNPVITDILEGVAGVDSAAWNYETSLSIVKFNPEKTSSEQIQKQLSRAGFNTQYFAADTLARRKLPECCQKQLDRKLKEKGH